MSETLYQLKVTLAESDPPIWRRVVVPATMTLKQLHLVLQVVMGWTNFHLYQFRLGEALFGDPEDDDYGMGVRPAGRKRLSALVKEGVESFVYEYDLGDDWQHDVVVEETVMTDGYRGYPAYLEGERACPPEDSGGIDRYHEILEVIREPEHEEYEDWLQWLGEDFDPEMFDRRGVNRTLALLASLEVI